jgi:hypothetical protein
MRYAGAAVLAFILTGKVFTSQYMIWLFPFMAVVGGWTGRRVRWLFSLCCLLTIALFPWSLGSLMRAEIWAVGLLNLRNFLLLGLLILLLFGPESPPAVTGPQPRMGSDSPATDGLIAVDSNAAGGLAKDRR